jgi:hypothetical protein
LLRQQVAQLVVLGADRSLRQHPDQQVVRPPELDALVDELLPLIGLRLDRLVAGQHEEISPDEHDRQRAERHCRPICRNVAANPHASASPRRLAVRRPLAHCGRNDQRTVHTEIVSHPRDNLHIALSCTGRWRQ